MRNAGRRVLLLLRHGQCSHEGEYDELKALTAHGHQQADSTARYIKTLLDAGKLPARHALLHSTSRRARETAAKLPNHLPGMEVMNSDVLRETDPTKNPMRAETAFQNLFAPPSVGDDDTLIVVAHNNIILYWLMRAAGIPIERAAQAWHLFHLRHASVTRLDVERSGGASGMASSAMRVVSVGAAGHIPDAQVTWNNIKGEDMSAWKGGEPERHKFSGRMALLVCCSAAAGRTLGSARTGEGCTRHAEAVASHVRALGAYMISGRVRVVCTVAGLPIATTVARSFDVQPLTLPEGLAEEPEAAFLQFLCAPEDRNRDAVVLVAEEGPVIYWLLRALGMSSEEVRATASSYRVSEASVTLINIKRDSMSVLGVGDTGHLPITSAPL